MIDAVYWPEFHPRKMGILLFKQFLAFKSCIENFPSQQKNSKAFLLQDTTYENRKKEKSNKNKYMKNESIFGS